MKKLSYKNKFFTVISAFLLVVLILFSYVIKLFDNGNAVLAEKTQISKKELAELQAEQRNFELGKKDLSMLEHKSIQPEDFFSSDTSLVREIKSLEDLARSLEVNLSLQVSGTVNSAPKAKTSNEIRSVPFSMQVSGSFPGAMSFLESLENLGFVTYVRSVSVSPSEKGSITLILTGNFYVRK